MYSIYTFPIQKNNYFGPDIGNIQKQTCNQYKTCKTYSIFSFFFFFKLEMTYITYIFDWVKCGLQTEQLLDLLLLD